MNFLPSRSIECIVLSDTSCLHNSHLSCGQLRASADGTGQDLLGQRGLPTGGEDLQEERRVLQRTRHVETQCRPCPLHASQYYILCIMYIPHTAIHIAHVAIVCVHLHWLCITSEIYTLFIALYGCQEVKFKEAIGFYEAIVKKNHSSVSQ